MEEILINYLNVQKHNLFYLKTLNWIRPATAKSYKAVIDEEIKVCAENQQQIDDFIDYFGEYEPFYIADLYKLYKSIENNDNEALNLDKSKIVDKTKKSKLISKDKKLLKFFSTMINNIDEYIEKNIIISVEKAYDCYETRDENQYIDVDYGCYIAESTAKKRQYIDEKLKFCAYNKMLFDRFSEYVIIRNADQKLEHEEHRILNESESESESENDKPQEEVKFNKDHEFKYEKINKLNADKFYNLDTNREVVLSTASKKNAYCLELKCCSDNAESFQEFITYINDKYNKNYTAMIKSVGSPAKAAKDRNSYKKVNIPGSIRDEIWAVYCTNKHKNMCYCCGLVEITSNRFEAGHVISESKGGKITIENLRPICSNCNRTMQTKNLFEYMKDNYPELYKIRMQSESIVIYISTCNDGEYNLNDFYKNYVKYCKTFKVVPINKQVVKYYLKGQEILDDGKVIIGNIEDSDDE